ncbi:MAG: hypothetical protein K2K71_00420, partial [Eubacterium sp.]|nr:hypothetical protein [Eubacterium sp.]
ALKKLFEELSAAVIFFTAREIFAIVIGILITKEVLKNGINFYEDKMEFTGIDENNLFSYEEIEEIETYHDTKASLTKNFVDRHALIIITKKDETVTTIDIGLTTKGTLKKIKKELLKHIEEGKIRA